MSKKYLTCIILDKNLSSISSLKKHLLLVPRVQVLESFESSYKALQFIQKNEPIDILFLEVDFLDINGIEFAHIIRHNINHIVFVTKNRLTALKAFEVNAHGYLLKPIISTKLVELINSFLRILDSNHKFNLLDCVYIRTVGGKGKIIKIDLEQIILIHAENNHISINTSTESFRVKESLLKTDRYFQNDSRFLRVHKSFIINTTKILSLHSNVLNLERGWKAQVGYEFKNKLNQLIENKLLI